jgi:hypothetical protein
MTFCQLERNKKERLSPFIKVLHAYWGERTEESQNVAREFFPESPVL